MRDALVSDHLVCAEVLEFFGARYAGLPGRDLEPADSEACLCLERAEAFAYKRGGQNCVFGVPMRLVTRKTGPNPYRRLARGSRAKRLLRQWVFGDSLTLV